MAVRSQAFVPEIESLRGVASTLVVLLHLQGWVSLGLSTQGWAWPLSAFVLSGHTGVSLFFVISGYLLTPQFLSAAPLSLSTYARRRALRILPAYAAVVVIAAVVCAQRPAEITRALPYLFFLQAAPTLVTPMNPFSAVWWSLSTEVQFYLLLPLAALVLRRLDARLGLLIGAGVFVVYVTFARRWWGASDPVTYIALAHSALGRGPLFLTGALAAVVNRHWGEPARRAAAATPWLRRGGADLLLLINLLLLAWLLRAVAVKGYWSAEAEWQLWHAVEGGLWTSLLLALQWLPAHLKVLLSNRLWAAVGLVSYSLYLWHNPVITYGMRLGAIAASGIDVPIRAVAALISCLLVATLAYAVLERPFLKHRGRK